MFTAPVPITILLSALATGKAVKILAGGRCLVLLLFDKDRFNAYLQGVSWSVLVSIAEFHTVYIHIGLHRLNPKSSG